MVGRVGNAAGILVFTVIALTVLGCAPPQSQTIPPSTDDEEPSRLPIDYPDKGNPKLDSALNQLIDAYNQGKAEEFARQRNIKLVDGKVRVEIRAVPGQLDVAANVSASVGTVELISRRSNGIQAVMPITSLTMLAEEESIGFIRDPIRGVAQ